MQSRLENRGMNEILACAGAARKKTLVRLQWTAQALAGLAVASTAIATTTDTTFAGAQTLVHGWIHGSLGGVIRTASLIVGMGVAVRTQKLYVAVAVGLTVLFFPDVVEKIFGATL